MVHGLSPSAPPSTTSESPAGSDASCKPARPEPAQAPEPAPLRLGTRGVLYHYVPPTGLLDGVYGLIGETYADSAELVRRSIPPLAQIAPERIILFVPPNEAIRPTERGWCRVLPDAWPALLRDTPTRFKVGVAPAPAPAPAAAKASTSVRTGNAAIPEGPGRARSRVAICSAVLGVLALGLRRPCVSGASDTALVIASVVMLALAVAAGVQVIGTGKTASGGPVDEQK